MSHFTIGLPKGREFQRKAATFLNLRKGFISGLNEDVCQKFEARLNSEKPEFVILDSSLFGPLAPIARRHGCKVVIQTHNCEFDFFAGQVALQGGLSAEMLRAGYNSEQAGLNNADLVIALSEYDSHRLRYLYDPSCPVVVSNPHLRKLYSKLSAADGSTQTEEKRDEAVFLGSAGYQNRLACDRLIEHWTPDNPRLKIVGSVGHWVNQKYSATLLASRGVDVLGYVDSLDALLQRATVMLCPMALGSGVKVKILDALANKCRVLASPEAMNGFEFAKHSGFLEEVNFNRPVAEDFWRSPRPLQFDELLNSLNLEVERQATCLRTELSRLGLHN
ncbi:glycosyltransferase [Pandoraea apista]|uniref:glycosyltransferase n=1 Tax=Pandoraea apista TaxID=93218 RepID=UPI0009099167|nr:glycosyltransferase [Pandoraea apista]ALS66406.2 hypothetical protein AT395_16745 [Pandoraea apista]